MKTLVLDAVGVIYSIGDNRYADRSWTQNLSGLVCMDQMDIGESQNL